MVAARSRPSPPGISCIAAAVPAPHDFASPPVPRRPRRRWGAGPQVHSPKCPTCPLVGVSAAASFPRLTCPRQHPFQGRAPGPVSGQLSTDHPGRGSRCCGLRFPAAFRLPAFASWTPCPARRDSAPIAVGLPPQARIPAHLPRTLAGFPRFPRVRPGPGRALSMPRGRRCSLAIGSSVAAACRLTSAGPYSPRYSSPTRDVCMSRHRREFPGSRPIPALPLACGRTWLGRRPLGVPVSSRPDRSGTGHACHGGDGVEH